jgi:CheY-like chemotaxis protein
MKEKVPATILVVDDDEWSRNLCLTILTQENYETMFAADGIKALNLLRKHKRKPNLILMDMMMPHMNGIETTRRIKSIERFSAIPIIMVTGNSDKNVVISCLMAGAADFVVKPFNRDTLLHKIRKFLKDITVEADPIAVNKPWRNSDIINVPQNTSMNRQVIEISWLQLKPVMDVEIIYFNDKPYAKNCIADQGIIKRINELIENSGNKPVIKILSPNLPKRKY